MTLRESIGFLFTTSLEALSSENSKAVKALGVDAPPMLLAGGNVVSE
jgi:hypothetical protein